MVMLKEGSISDSQLQRQNIFSNWIKITQMSKPFTDPPYINTFLLRSDAIVKYKWKTLALEKMFVWVQKKSWQDVQNATM